jgi:hypothetical protein
MKTFLVIVVTATVTWFVASFVHGVQTGTERLWLISAVKAPGRMAIEDIQADMAAERYQLAKAKIDLLADTWHRFDSGPDSFRGSGIGDIMVTFSKLDTNSTTSKIRP